MKYFYFVLVQNPPSRASPENFSLHYTTLNPLPKKFGNLKKLADKIVDSNALDILCMERFSYSNYMYLKVYGSAKGVRISVHPVMYRPGWWG